MCFDLMIVYCLQFLTEQISSTINTYLVSNFGESLSLEYLNKLNANQVVAKYMTQFAKPSFPIN